DRIFVTNAAGEKVVTDMFEFAFVKFAIFNVADMFITFGAVMLCVYMIFYESKYEKLLKNAKNENNA
ncbi:MAG: signal peptidase II, partial [Clostridia bacterium]